MALSRETPRAALVDDDGGYGRARRKVFVLVFSIVVLAGAIYTLLQPTTYRSTATVLMSAPTAIDQQMLEADVQGVTIQRRILTGREITLALAEEMNTLGVALDAVSLRGMLDVTSVTGTNVVELSATGADEETLPLLVETWIDVYTAARADDIETRKSTTLREVQEELDGLQVRLTDARQALDDYRAENEIISMERQENEVLSRLDGLNKALNRAVEEEVKAEAYLDALKSSLAAGEQIVPQNERSDVASMARQLTELRTRLDRLRDRYTDEYIFKDPELRRIPEQIDELEETLTRAYSEGSRAELTNAERDYRTARESVRDIERRLEAHKQAVTEFNTVYATHEALVDDLSRLEELNRETQARLVQIEVKQVEKYPQVSVVDWPTAEPQRVGPPYLLLVGGTVGGAFLLGVLGVWLWSYLHPRPVQAGTVTLTGVHMYPQDGAQALGQMSEAQARLQAANAPRLDEGADTPALESTSSPDEGSADDEHPREAPDPERDV